MKWIEKNIKYPKIIESIISVFLVFSQFSMNCRYLNNPIQFILKHSTSLLDTLQLIAMGSQRGGIDLPCFGDGVDRNTVAAVKTTPNTIIAQKQYIGK